jgi:hypothetical protein
VQGKRVVNLLALLVFVCAGCASTHEHRDPAFTITPEVIGPPLVGFGAQMNPYLYCTPNWGEVNETNVKDLEAKVVALHPQHVRIFMMLDWFSEKPNDEISKTDPRVRESFLRTVRLAQRAGATVNITLWFGFWKTPEESMKRFADILAMLVNEEHLTAIQYVTIGNETNDHEAQIPITRYNQCYLALDRELKRVGLRDHIKIISGDLTLTNQERWFANIAQNLAQISDGYSIHVYWDYWDTAKLQRRVDEVPRIVAALPAGTQRPLYITEFGVRGVNRRFDEPGYALDGTPIGDTPEQAMQIAWFTMEAINHGYVATVQWDCYVARYDRLMSYGLIDDVRHGFKTRPAYDVLRLFTHTSQRGWRAVKIVNETNSLAPVLRGEGGGEGLDAFDNTERNLPTGASRPSPQPSPLSTGEREQELETAAIRSGDGNVCVYVLNRSEREKTIRIGGNLAFATQWRSGKLSRTRSVRPNSDGVSEIRLPPNSLVALTTLRPDL